MKAKRKAGESAGNPSWRPLRQISVPSRLEACITATVQPLPPAPVPSLLSPAPAPSLLSPASCPQPLPPASCPQSSAPSLLPPPAAPLGRSKSRAANKSSRTLVF